MYLPFFWILVQSFWRNFLDLFFSSLLLTEFAMIFYTVFMLFVLCHTQYSGLLSFFPYERILEPSANCSQFHFMQCLGYLFYRFEHTKNSTIVRRALFLGLASLPFLRLRRTLQGLNSFWGEERVKHYWIWLILHVLLNLSMFQQHVSQQIFHCSKLALFLRSTRVAASVVS